MEELTDTPTTSRPYYDVTLGKSVFTIDSRYQRLRAIGRGAYGLVAAAEDVLTGRQVRSCVVFDMCRVQK